MITSRGLNTSGGFIAPKMIDSILGWSILASVSLYAPGVSLAKFSVVFFQIFTACFIASTGFFNKERNIRAREIAWSAWLYFTACAVNVIAFQFQIIPIACFLNFSWAMALIFSVAVFVRDTEKVKRFIVWASVLSCAYLAIQKFGWNPILNSEITQGEEGGLMGNAANLGSLLAICLPITCEASMLAWPLFFLIGWVQHESALILICCLYLLVTHPRSVIFLTGFGTLFFITRGSDILHSSLGGRMDIWRCTIEQTFQSPFFGWGLGNRPEVTSQMHHVVNSKPDFVYSSHLQFIFSTGLIGAVAWFYSIKTFFYNMRLKSEDMAILSLIILSIAKYPIEIQRLWVLICALIGLWMIRIIKEREEALCM